MEETKPGFKTSEFWLTALAQIIGVVLEALAVPLLEKSEKPWAPMVLLVVAVVLQVCTMYGYQKGRTLVKASAVAAEGASLGGLPPVPK
jgi:hypothetical protein